MTHTAMMNGSHPTGRISGWKEQKTNRLSVSAVVRRILDFRRSNPRSGSTSRWERFPDTGEEALNRIHEFLWDPQNCAVFRWMR